LGINASTLFRKVQKLGGAAPGASAPPARSKRPG
jgi:hypothetical protein